MSVKDRISSTLQQALDPIALEVIDESQRHAGHAGSRAGGETHFHIKVVSKAFAGKSRLDRHRLINSLLAEELRDRVHALAITAKAPGE
jgi:BolA protein